MNKWSTLFMFEDSHRPLNPHSTKVFYTYFWPRGSLISGSITVVSLDLRNDIPTATPRPYRKSKISGGGFGAYQHGSIYISACRPDSNEIPIANTMFSGSGISMATFPIMFDVSGSRSSLGKSQLEWSTPKTLYLHLEFRCYTIYYLWHKYFCFIAGRHLDFRLSANLKQCWQYISSRIWAW